MENKPLILVTGATGYVGGRLVPRLLEVGYKVRILARDPARLRGRSWLEQVEVVKGDVSVPNTLTEAMAGVDTAYYLIHSLAQGSQFIESETSSARNFAGAARDADVRNIIYLGQLGQQAEGKSESPYLKSRHLTGEALKNSGLPVTEFRVGVIVGSGSVTFEMIRYLTERWPFLVCPLWAYTFGQPILITDVLAYLISALELPVGESRIVEIGGPDQLTFTEMLLGYSIERGLTRFILPVRVMTPGLSAYWTRLITPITVNVARPQIEMMASNAIVMDNTAEQLFPQIKPMPYHKAVRRAILRTDANTVETSWSDALVTSMGEIGTPVILGNTEGFYIERRERVVDASPEACYQAFTSLGGDTGWLYWNWTWSIRGWMDELVGGVGLRRGRRHATDLRIGEAVDFWRVEVLEPNRLMRLRAEMKVPGGAWLECQVKPLENGKSLLQINALFEPKGVSGPLYWYFFYIPHVFIFSGMARKIAERAIKIARQKKDTL
jgi:uncharacterized protein YbjT (DUF2867 family)